MQTSEGLGLDEFRAWFDDIDFGATARATPLQAALLSEAVAHSTRKLAVIDDHVRTLVRGCGLSTTQPLSGHSTGSVSEGVTSDVVSEGVTSDGVTIDVESVVDDILHSLMHSDYSLEPLFPPTASLTHTHTQSKVYPSTTEEIFQFASDLQTYHDPTTTLTHSVASEGVSEGPCKRAKPSNNGHSVHLKTPTPTLTHTHSHTHSVACQTNPVPQPSSTHTVDRTRPLSHSHKPTPFRPPSTTPNTTTHTTTHNSNAVSSTTVSECVSAAVKKNPFLSAKEQFVADGGKFKQPALTHSHTHEQGSGHGQASQRNGSNGTSSDDEKAQLPLELQQFEPKLVRKIESEILQDRGKRPVLFQDIAGLEFAKKCVQEIICWPMLRPDLFTGLRALPKGLLLFGPPGTGKTLIGKAIAQQAGATFFSISASSLTSKWVGESEGLVRVLFAVAAYHQPSVVFIDEVDSLLTQRSSDESEASRRIKTEFLVQLDGAGGGGTSNRSAVSECGSDKEGSEYREDARVVVIGATNRPDELDEAARRRFAKRLYIPLPDTAGREQLVTRLLSTIAHDMTESEQASVVVRTEGYSGADIKNLCTEASLGPVRDIAAMNVHFMDIKASDVPPISMRHFEDALQSVGASVSTSDLDRYIEWNKTFGTYRRME